MITPSHIIYSWTLAKKTALPNIDTRKRTLAFVLGAFFPDTPTYLFFIICGIILGYSGQTMWDDMFFNSGWAIPVTLAHSFIIWPILATSAAYFGWKFLKWFSLSALFHSLVDFWVHTDDTYRHFWPISDWKFHSPISYYNRAEWGEYVNIFDSLLVLGLLTYLYTRYTGKWRVLICSISLLYIIHLFAEPIHFVFMYYGT